MIMKTGFFSIALVNASINTKAIERNNEGLNLYAWAKQAYSQYNRTESFINFYKSLCLALCEETSSANECKF